MDNSMLGLLGGFLAIAINLVIMVVMYVYFSYTFMTIARKTGTPGAWMAWVPIANLILMLNIVKKPLWWAIILFIPIVNLLLFALLFMALSEKCNKPAWVGLLIFFPLGGLFLPAYLAFKS